jgi:hypothetical protein
MHQAAIDKNSGIYYDTSALTMAVDPCQGTEQSP